MEHDAIVQLTKLEIPTHSYIAAAQEAGKFRDFCDTQSYNEMIEQITTKKAEYATLQQAQMVFCYLVQELVRDKNSGNMLTLGEIYTRAELLAESFIEREPWHWAVAEGTDTSPTISAKETANRIIKEVKDQSRSDIIKAICDEMNVAPITALYYYRAFVKENPDQQVTSPERVKIDKKKVSLEFVKNNSHLPRKQVIEQLAELVNTTKAGAQTYYYNSIKELGIVLQKAPRSNTREKLKEALTANPNMSKIEFLEYAEVHFNMKVTTAQTYYYELIKIVKNTQY